MLGLGLTSYLPIVVYLIVWAVFLLSIFWKHELGLYLLVILLPQTSGLHKMSAYFLGNHVLEILILGIFLGLLLRGQTIIQRTTFGRIFFALALVSYLSMWVGSLLTGAEYPLLPRDRMAHWIMFQRLPVIFYLVLATVRDRRQMAVLLLCMAFSYLMLSRGTRGAVAGRDISFYRQNLRVEGALGQPNMLGAMMAQCAAYCLGFFGVARGKALKVLVFAAFLVGCVVVMFTYSRGAYVALAAGVLYLTMLRMPYLLLLLIPMGAAWQVWLPGAVAERISMTYDDQGELEGSSAKRFELWNFAWNLIKSQPVLGVGFDTFRYFRADEELQDTHNLYIRVQVETGILGLAVLGWLFLKSYLTGFRLYRKGKDPFLRAIGLGFSAYMVALVMANMFGDRWTYIALSGYTFTLLALTVRAQEMENGEAVAAVPQETAPPFAPGIQTGFVGGRSANLPR